MLRVLSATRNGFWLVATVLLLGASHGAAAAPPTLAEQRLAAEKGDIQAAAAVGDAYWNGVGVERDYTEAVKWFRIAAEGGIATGQEALGQAYLAGIGLPRDLDQALVWARKAAAQGAASARVRLVLVMLERKEAPDKAAMEGLQKAADERFLPARSVLGFCLVAGKGVPADVTKGLLQLEESAQDGDTEAVRGLMILHRDGIGIPVDDPKARAYFERLAELDSAAALELGIAYASGIKGFDRDSKKGLRLIKRAAEGGLVPAVVILGERLIDGGLGEKNPVLGADFLRRAAETGSVEGQTSYAMVLLQGIGVPRDPAAGIALLRKAAEAGSSRAWDSLSICYATGQGVEQDAKKALEMSWKAVGAEGAPPGSHGPAYVRLAEALYGGVGTPRDEKGAEAVLRRGAVAGYPEAQRGLALLAAPEPARRDEALEWFRKASRSGDRVAKVELGRLLVIDSRTSAEGKEGVALLREAAEDGDLSALFYLGVMHDDGHPEVPKDRAKALDLLGRAADAGEPRAALRLAGQLLRPGAPEAEVARGMAVLEAAAAAGVPAVQVELARVLARRSVTAAEVARATEMLEGVGRRGYPMGFVVLGDLYLNGLGGPRSQEKAEAQYRRAAEAGEPVAACRLQSLRNSFEIPEVERVSFRAACLAGAAGDGDAAVAAATMALSAYGGPEDRPLARRLFESALASGLQLAALKYGYALLIGAFGPDEIVRGRPMLQPLADAGIVPALHQLGKAKILAIGGPADVAGGRADLERAASLGLADAMFDLGIFYSEGGAVPPDLAKAREWFGKGAEAGHITSMVAMADLLLNQATGPDDGPTAAAWMRKAAELGDARAMNGLGRFLATGAFMPADPVAAFQWIERSAKGGWPAGMSGLGIVFLNGDLGQPADIDVAVQWFQKALQHGDRDAGEALAHLHRLGRGVPLDPKRAWALASLVLRAGGIAPERAAALQQFTRELEAEIGPEGVAEAETQARAIRDSFRPVGQ